MRVLTFAVLLCGLLSIDLSASAAVGKTSEALPSHLTLARGGISQYTISVASDAISSEKTAAYELSRFLQQVTGASLPVKDESLVADDAPQILVGAGQRVKKILPNFKWESLGTEGIVIKTSSNSLVLAGGRPRGTLYATYQFLEDVVGIRWWAPDSTYVPKKPTLNIALQNTFYTPKLVSRDAYYSTVIENPAFSTRLKVNGHMQRQGPELGGHMSILGWCHTVEQLLPIEKYFADHPEWFSDPTHELSRQFPFLNCEILLQILPYIII